MTSVQKRIFGLLLFMAAVAFVLFALPNAVASQNLSMVQIFQPDEAAPLPYVLQMIAPSPTLNLALRHFIFYDYYYYGFPFFAPSALLLLPLQWLGRLGDIPLVMLVLRQFISVLPMLAALLRFPQLPFASSVRLPAQRAGCGTEQFLVSPGWDYVPPGCINHLLPETG